MEAPKLPGLFKISKHRQFDFKTRYYNDKNTTVNINQNTRPINNNLKNQWGLSKRSQTNRRINKILFIAFFTLSILTFLILKA